MDKIRESTTPKWMKKFNEDTPDWAGGRYEKDEEEKRTGKPSAYAADTVTGRALRTQMRQSGSPGTVFTRGLRRADMKKALREMRGGSVYPTDGGE